MTFERGRLIDCLADPDGAPRGIGQAWVFPAPNDPKRPTGRHAFQQWLKRAKQRLLRTLAGEDRDRMVERLRGLGYHGEKRAAVRDPRFRQLPDTVRAGRSMRCMTGCRSTISGPDFNRWEGKMAGITQDKLADPPLSSDEKRRLRKLLDAQGQHWTTTLRCPRCQSMIRYVVDEAPPWHESEKRIWRYEQAREALERAGGTMLVPGIYAGPRPPEIALWGEHGWAWAYQQVEPLGGSRVTGMADIDFRCIDCPSCGAEVLVEHGIPIVHGPGTS